MSLADVRVANAPVSFGVFEMTIGRLPNLPTAAEVLDAVAGAGYEGIDLGPLGFLGEGEALREALRSRGLGLAGGYVALRFLDAQALAEDLRQLERTLETFQGLGEEDPRFQPKPTLADAGSPLRATHPGQAKDHPELRLDEADWRRLAEGVIRADELCRSRGFEPTFHHHSGTYVEAPQEIERLLELTQVALCLDSGHLLIGGGDPLGAIRDWGSRINHVHLKDVRLDLLRSLVAEGADMETVWRRGAFCELGQGNLDLPALLAGLSELGYEGWMVIEQDRIPAAGESAADAADAQERNRRYLQTLGL